MGLTAIVAVVVIHMLRTASDNGLAEAGKSSLDSGLSMTSPRRAERIVTGQHLLGIEELPAAEIMALLDLGNHYVELSRQIDKRRDVLAGRTQINLFYEASTRTQSSFGSPASGLAPTS